MSVFRCLLLICVMVAAVVSESPTDPADASDPNDHAGEAKPRILLRKRRTPDLPSSAHIRFESKLTVPQSPTGLYQIWFGPVRFFIQQLFSSTRWVVRSGPDPAVAGRGHGHGLPG